MLPLISRNKKRMQKTIDTTPVATGKAFIPLHTYSLFEQFTEPWTNTTRENTPRRAIWSLNDMEEKGDAIESINFLSWTGSTGDWTVFALAAAVGIGLFGLSISTFRNVPLSTSSSASGFGGGSFGGGGGIENEEEAILMTVLSLSIRELVSSS